MFYFNQKSQNSRLAIAFVVTIYKELSRAILCMRRVKTKAAKWIFWNSCCLLRNDEYLLILQMALVHSGYTLEMVL